MALLKIQLVMVNAMKMFKCCYAEYLLQYAFHNRIESRRSCAIFILIFNFPYYLFHEKWTYKQNGTRTGAKKV